MLLLFILINLLPAFLCQWTYTPDILSLYLTNDNYEDLLLTNDNLDALQTDLNVVFYTHGYLSDSTSVAISDMQYAFQIRNDSNFIKVDWRKLANELYTSSAMNVCVVGKNLGQFIALLDANGFNMTRIHTIGLSLGAHVSGTAGRVAHKLTNMKIGRTTGLDPAGPLFLQILNLSIGCLIQSTDAQFVDILHTNAGVFGTLEELGTVDFYANCGTYQPGCSIFDIQNVTLENILFNDQISCSHVRSVDLFTESINSNNFIAGRERTLLSLFSSCKNRVVFGMNVPLNATNEYYFKTNSESPYALGDDGACQSCLLS